MNSITLLEDPEVPSARVSKRHRQAICRQPNKVNNIDFVELIPCPETKAHRSPEISIIHNRKVLIERRAPLTTFG